VPADRLDVFQRVPQLLLDQARALDQRHAVGREAHAARGARHQRHAQFALQLGDGLRQRRLRGVQAARGLVDAAVLGHGQQDAQLLQLHRGAVFFKKGRENAVSWWFSRWRRKGLFLSGIPFGYRHENL
jgi:hypothetical protein